MGSSGSVRVIGVDPGLASVGWGIVDREGSRLSHIAHGCLMTDPRKEIAERLAEIRDGLAEVLEGFRPREGAMETLYFSKNVSSALKVSEAKGVIRLLFRDRAIPLAEYGPAALKQATAGSGRAGKGDVQDFVRIILGLPDIPKPDHAADALAAAICHCNSRFVSNAIASAAKTRV